MLQRRAEKWSRSNEEGGGTWGMREKGENSPASAETERQREYSEQRLRTQRQIY